jgi:dipeptidyl aminopeptidase/acylaminoacyl peptidase
MISPGLLLAGALTFGAAGPVAAGDATPGATPTTGTGWTLASQETIGGDGMQPLALSPDGSAIAMWDTDQGEICSFPTITREAPTCAPFTASVLLDSVAWSPDGSRLVFTENFTQYLEESDIHVFDVGSGEVTNLTDDGVEGSPFGSDEPSDIDLAPAWSPDGTEIVFARSDSLRVDGTSLYRIAADGSGEADRIDRVSSYSIAVYGGIHWVEDDRILYSVMAPEVDPDNGIWEIDPAGGEPNQLVDANEYDTTTMILADASSDGASGLVIDQRAMAEYSIPLTRPTHYLLDLETGDTTALDFGAIGLPPSEALATDSGVPQSVMAVGFSPEGDRFAAAVTLPGGERQLWVVDIATVEHTVAGELDDPIGAFGTRPGLDWGENDSLLGPGAARTGILMMLEPAD